MSTQAGTTLAQQAPLTDVEDLLAHLICADADRDPVSSLHGAKTLRKGLNQSQTDAGSVLRFADMRPNDCYTAQRNAGRLYTADSRMLLHSAQDIIGRAAEGALICDDRIKWIGLRALKKAPRGLWVAKPGASLYEYHYREIFASGRSMYGVRVAAIGSDGAPVLTQIIGSRGASGPMEGHLAIVLASLIEDAHRPGALLARISDATSIRLPVPVGEHRDLFALREAPLTITGKRRAILHWVAKHTRLSNRQRSPVRAHWRGARTLQIDGMTVELSPNGDIT